MSDASSKSVRWGILSTAKIVRRFVTAVRSSARSHVVALASRNLEHARHACKSWQIPHAVGGYDQLLALDEIDAVYVPLPNQLHIEWTLRALEAGKHVLCEKPLSLRAQDVDTLARKAQESRCHVAEGLVHLYHEQTRAMAREISKGAIGSPRLMEGSYCLDFRGSDSIIFSPELGGGSLFGLGCYPVSLAMAVINATPTKILGTQVRHETGVDASFGALLTFESKAIASLNCSIMASEHQSFIVTGDEGAIICSSPYRPNVDGQVSGYLIRNNSGVTRRVHFLPTDPFCSEIESFECVVLEGANPQISLEFSRAVAETLELLLQQSQRDFEVNP